MAEDFYTKSHSKLSGLLDKVRTTGVPDKANKQWLTMHGYTSSNDSSLPKVLKSLGFLDQSNVPMRRWNDYRGEDPRGVLGVAIREAYSDLFDVFPDACDRGDAELGNFFRARTSGGADVVQRTVSTFKALCAQADLSGGSSLEADKPDLQSQSNDPSSDVAPSSGSQKSQATPSLHIDVQIHISPESSSEQIDQIFSSMAKHLYKKSDS